jgi:hypothetical protein
VNSKSSYVVKLIGQGPEWSQGFYLYRKKQRKEEQGCASIGERGFKTRH